MANLHVTKEEMEDFMDPATSDKSVIKAKLKVINDDYPKVQERVKILEDRLVLESADAGKFRMLRDQLILPDP